MFKAKELTIIIAVSIVIAFALVLKSFSLNNYLISLLLIFLVIIVNIFAKKIASFFLDSEIEVKLWEMKRWGFKSHHHFKKPVPTGVIFPVVITVITAGFLYWMASLVFEVKAKVYRAARRWGLYSFSEMTEWHIGLIAAWGIIANLLFAVLGYITGFSEFAKLNIYYAFFNIIPFSDLDGNKLFFGSIILWVFLTTLVLIALGYVFLLV